MQAKAIVSLVIVVSAAQMSATAIAEEALVLTATAIVTTVRFVLDNILSSYTILINTSAISTNKIRISQKSLNIKH